MYAMNFLFGNNFGFGGYGCCCRPMINPFMLGMMRFSLMNSLFNMNLCQPQSYFNFPMIQNYQQPYLNNFGTYSYAPQNTFEPIEYKENKELEDRYNKASQDWQNAFSKVLSSNKSATQASVTAGSSTAASSSAATKPETVSTTKDFQTRLNEVAEALVCKPEDLLALMNSESGLKANARNKSGQGAVGLIQFTTPAIQELNRHGVNVTKEQLASMSAVEQLDYIEKYLKIAKSYKFSANHPLSAGDLYAINFLPGRAGRDVLTSRGDTYYAANKGLDMNRDGQITKDDLAKRLDKFKVSLVA